MVTDPPGGHEGPRPVRPLQFPEAAAELAGRPGGAWAREAEAVARNREDASASHSGHPPRTQDLRAPLHAASTVLSLPLELSEDRELDLLRLLLRQRVDAAGAVRRDVAVRGVGVGREGP